MSNKGLSSCCSPATSTLVINLVDGPKIRGEKVDAKQAARSYDTRPSDARHRAGATMPPTNADLMGKAAVFGSNGSKASATDCDPHR